MDKMCQLSSIAFLMLGRLLLYVTIIWSFLSLIVLLLVSRVSRGMLCAFSISIFDDVLSQPLFSSCLISLFISLVFFFFFGTYSSDT